MAPTSVIALVAVLVAVGPQQSAPQAHADAEIHLIPDGYVGEVTIVFSAANGEPDSREGNARLYRIPTNGILLTQAEPNVGMSPAWKFFTVTSDGQRVPILRVWAGAPPDTPESRSHPGVEISLFRRGRLQAGRLPCDVTYDQYLVGTRAQILAGLSNDIAERLRRFDEFLQKNFICR
jgi:hypothetical protein